MAGGGGGQLGLQEENMKYTCNIHEKSRIHVPYTKYMHNICEEYTKYMHNIHRICVTYAKNTQRNIREEYTQHKRSMHKRIKLYR